VLIFNAREHIGHKETSITLSTPPSEWRVPGSYDDPLSRVKLPKMSQGGPHYATAWRRRDPAGQYPGYPPLIDICGARCPTVDARQIARPSVVATVA
jgi:hypothetical protein